MSYEEQQHRRSRVVVETPAARREVVETQVARVPERRGMSGGAVAALVIGAVALVTILFLFLLNRQNEALDATRVASTTTTTTTAPPPPPQQQPVIIQQPTTQPPPVILQQPATTTTQPIIVPAPTTTAPATTTTETAAPSGTDDLTVQSNIDKRLSDDQTLGSLGLIATVVEGKVTLTGTVNSEDLKSRAERVVRAVKGVKRVDNQIIVSSTE
jgi:BON domain